MTSRRGFIVGIYIHSGRFTQRFLHIKNVQKATESSASRRESESQIYRYVRFSEAPVAPVGAALEELCSEEEGVVDLL